MYIYIYIEREREIHVYVCIYIYIYYAEEGRSDHVHPGVHARGRPAEALPPEAARAPEAPLYQYTRFPSQDSGIFGANPWNILAPPSNYLSNKGFWATQTLEQIF